MTHDPLCPWEPETLWTGESSDLIYYRRPEIPCQCDLIAKVRADELRRPSEDGWMSVRAVLAWEDQVRADERRKVNNERIARFGYWHDHDPLEGGH
jgi:hypothetical protein